MANTTKKKPATGSAKTAKSKEPDIPKKPAPKTAPKTAAGKTAPKTVVVPGPWYPTIDELVAAENDHTVFKIGSNGAVCFPLNQAIEVNGTQRTPDSGEYIVISKYEDRLTVGTSGSSPSYIDGVDAFYVGQADIRKNNKGIINRATEPHPTISYWQTIIAVTTNSIKKECSK